MTGYTANCSLDHQLAQQRIEWTKIVTIIVVISTGPHLTNMSEHTALHKINNNVYIKLKTSKIIYCIVIILYSTHTHTRVYRRNVTRGEGGKMGESSKKAEYHLRYSL